MEADPLVVFKVSHSGFLNHMIADVDDEEKKMRTDFALAWTRLPARELERNEMGPLVEKIG